MKCAGESVDDMVLREPVGVKSALGENPKRVYGNRNTLLATRLGVAAVLRDAFRRTQDYRDRRDRAAADGTPFDRDPTPEVLVQVLTSELPWCQHVHRADDIATAIRLADEFGYRLLINHGTEAHLMAERIAQQGIPVISGPLIGARSKLELRHRTLRNPGVLDRAGVLLTLTTDHNAVPVQCYDRSTEPGSCSEGLTQRRHTCETKWPQRAVAVTHAGRGDPAGNGARELFRDDAGRV